MKERDQKPRCKKAEAREVGARNNSYVDTCGTFYILGYREWRMATASFLCCTVFVLFSWRKENSRRKEKREAGQKSEGQTKAAEKINEQLKYNKIFLDSKYIFLLV